MIRDRMDLQRIRHSRRITDPFPEHSQHEAILRMLEQNRGAMRSLFGWVRVRMPEAPRPVSIWEAYRLGYDQAYREIEDALSEGGRPWA